jgi:hypothetical protein
MKTYGTSATVEDQGRVLVAGVPFEPGARVEVSITPIQQNGAGPPGVPEPDRAQRLLAALDKARNSEAIGELRRAQLYHRGER